MLKLNWAAAALAAALLTAGSVCPRAEPLNPAPRGESLTEIVSFGSKRVPRWLVDTISRAAFLEGTWLEVLNEHAAKHGYGAAADAITVVAGKPVVTDPANSQWILSLREDPFLSALMACEMVKKSRDRLTRERDRALTDGELYLTHLLGSAGASRLLKLVAEKPQESAPKAFQAAAKANKNLFYVAEQKQRKEATVAEVHARISAMMEDRVTQYASAN
ncbi:MAG: lytic transglycosylase protein [Microvirga sp.]|nr:lytic transglycosylase protein [Microvirga sp.]